MDFNRYAVRGAAAQKESRRKATQVVIKEMKFRPKIDIHDYTTKMRHVERFLAEGNKVKLTIMFRGREMAHPELGLRILERIADEVSEIAIVESAPRQDGRNMTMVLHPITKAGEAKRKGRRPRRRDASRPDPAPAARRSRSARDGSSLMPKQKTHRGAAKRFKRHRQRQDPSAQGSSLAPAREEVEHAHAPSRPAGRGHRRRQEARRASARPRLTPQNAPTRIEERDCHGTRQAFRPLQEASPLALLEAAEGYSGSRSRHLRKANEQLMHSGQLRLPRPPRTQGPVPPAVDRAHQRRVS